MSSACLRYNRSSQGFSLAEVALALAIISLALGAIVPALISMRTAEQARVTRAALDNVARSVSAYVQSHGCLPCPSAITSMYGTGFGVVRGDVSGNPAYCGVCSAAVGYVPFKSLGLPASAARDGYGRWMTYAVDAVLANIDWGIVVPPNSICRSVDEAIKPEPRCDQPDVYNKVIKQGFCRQRPSDVDARLRIVLQGGSVTYASMLVMSHGANGRGAIGDNGAKLRNPNTAVCNAGVTGNEKCNADIDANFADVLPSGGADPFDDILFYLDRNAIVTMAGGPPCNTAW